MSVSKRVAAALAAFAKDDAEQALHDICSAIEVTSAAEFGKGGRSSYKKFVSDNFALICRSAFGVDGTIGSLRVQFNHPDLTPASDGLCSFEEILYHVVRCGLYHEATLPTALIFVKANVIKCDGGTP